MAQTAPVTKRSLFYWAFSGNTKLQLILLALIILIVGTRVLPLEMQKRIVNEAIALQMMDSLLLYCSIYLAAITMSAALKLAINYLQALIGERAMIVMRQRLYEHILTLPLGFFRTTQPGMVVSSLMTELSTAGNFAGMAFAVPLTNILTLLAFACYLLWLNTKLAMATLVIYPAVILILPYLQKRANAANKARVDLSRATASQIAESISGIHEVQVHGAYLRENSKFNHLAEQLKTIRVRWSLLRFAIKTANNYFVGIGPFIIFIFGGYLIMHGELELGAMVAFLSAQEKLYDPWKELIDFYQSYQDAKVSYQRTMESFDEEPDFLPGPPLTDKKPVSGEIRVSGLSFQTSEGHRLLSSIDLQIKAGEHLAVVGFSGSGKSTLIQCIGKMFAYSSGSITIDGRELALMSKEEAVQAIGYISQSPFIFTGTIEENLLYAAEAVATGSQRHEIELDRKILVLQQSGLFVDVMRFGLDSLVPPGDELTIETIIRIRKRFKVDFGDRLSGLVEFYNQDNYLTTSSIAENIVYGTHVRNQRESLQHNEQLRQYLESSGLTESLLEVGADLARNTVDLLVGLDSVDLFFENSPVAAEQLDECQAIVNRLEKSSLAELPAKMRSFLLSLALGFIPRIHTMSKLNKEMMARLLQARKDFPGWAESNAPGSFAFYCESSYLHGQSILNNIFFGKITSRQSLAQEKINQSVMQLLIEENYLEEIAAIGMNFQVGSMGDRLSGGQRQKLAIARVLLKDPDLLLMDEATSALDNKSQSRIQRLLETRYRGQKTVIAVVHRLDIIPGFDRVAVMKGGKIAEVGGYQELIDKKGLLHELIYGKSQ